MELLVVIAIIGILAAILMPVLSRAKERAYAVTDVNNTKQILLATHVFAGDNDDSLPLPGWGTEQSCWLFGVPLPLGGSGTQAGYEAVYPQQLEALKNGQLYQYLNSPKMFMCPTDWPDNLFYARDVYITSYIWNGAVCGYSTTDKSFKLSQFKPDAILQWEEDENRSKAYNDAADYPHQGFTRRHGGTLNGDPADEIRRTVTTGVFDGSAKRASAGELNALAGIPDADKTGPLPGTVLLPNALWCNPATTNGTPSS